jgi:tripartite-type tricarboxylate transporter receptor subunit TctC
MNGLLRRGTSIGVISAMMFVFSLQVSLGQDFPTKPVSLIIPFGAGGSSDLTFRAIIGTANEYLGQPVVIQVKPGGGGAIASEMVAQSKPDGYTLLSGHTNCNSILPAVEGRSRGPDDYAPVCLINIDQGIVVTQADTPFKSVKEMVEWAKANPGRLTFGVPGTWSIPDFQCRLIEQKAGIKIRVVPYDGGGQALIGLLGGHVQVALLAPTQTLPQIRAGKLRPLAFEGTRRHPDLPDLPTLTEEGLGTGITGAWKGVMAPKGTPKPIIDKLASAFKKMTETDEAKSALKKLGGEFDYQGPAEFEKYWRTEYQTYKELGKQFKK